MMYLVNVINHAQVELSYVIQYTYKLYLNLDRIIKRYQTKHQAHHIQSILFSLHVNFQVEDLDESADE